MNTTELLDLFRQEVSDVETPYLWSDALVYSYIDDAQKQFCRDTNGIADSRSFKLTITPGIEWYAIDPKIIKLRDAVFQTTGQDVPIISVEKMAENGMRFDGAVGPLKALISGLDDGMLRAYPMPNESTIVELRTFRLSVDVEAGDDFEIAPKYHTWMLPWVKHRAYGVQDSEVFDKAASAKFLAEHKALMLDAKHEQNRIRRPVSTVTYGGI